MGMQMEVINSGTSREIDAAFATLVRERPDAVFVGLGLFFLAVVSNWSNWRRATRFPRISHAANLPKSAD